MAVYIIPVAVQGQRAAGEICDAFGKIERWNKQGSIDFDVIILARGGGSLEDLSTFNDETLAKAIFKCHIPVVSAIGHEVDVSIADLVADLRAATPTAAAELVSKDQTMWTKALKKNYLLLEKIIRLRILGLQTETEYLRKRLRNPRNLLQEQSQKIDQAEQTLIKTMRNVIELETLRLTNLRRKLVSFSPLYKINALNNELGNNKILLIKAIKQQLTLISNQLSYTIKLLDKINPEKILARGYAVLTTNDGKTIKNRSEVKEGTHLIATMSLGNLHVNASRWEDKTHE